MQPAYAAALADEIRQVGGKRQLPVHTIFFGGGTPSLMTAEEMGVILTAVSQTFALSPNAEISMECNPGTVTEEYLHQMRELGINRLSFGVQSVVQSELTLLEREHDFETVVRAVEMSRTAGFDNFNLDLIYGVPNQTLASWEKSLDAVLSLDSAHLSLYCLTIEPGTPMQRWLLNGRIQPPDPDLAADQYEMAGAKMAAQGFDHYEISNWSKPNMPCEHNLTYWRNKPYLGLGAGAHGYASDVRYEVVKQPRVYIRRMGEDEGEERPFPLSNATADHHTLTRQEAMSDTIITQLRLLNEGLDLTAFAKTFGDSLENVYANTLPNLLEWDLIKIEGEKLLLTENGRFLSNQVFYRFM